MSFWSQVPKAVRHELIRLELLGRLADHEGQLTVLIAPGGYGKTTLLAQHARRFEGRAVWLTLGPDDADPLVLSQHLVGALRKVMPTLRLEAWEQLSHVGGSAEGLATALAHDLTRSTTNFEFILDGSDSLMSAAGRWLAQWMNSLTEGHRVLLAGRAEPPIGLAHRVARGDAQLIGLKDLAFSAMETAECLTRSGDGFDVEVIHARLEGWPVGVALVGSGASPQLTPADLLEDVLAHLPVSLQQALPEASVLDVWDEAQATQFGLALPDGWVQTVRQAGLPLMPLGGSYRPHQLLREVLDARLRRQHSRFQALHLRIGNQAEQSGHRLQALEHYRLAGAYEQALLLARDLADEYENRWEYQLVRRVLEVFPEQHLPPDLRRLLGHALLETGEGTRGEELLYRLRQARQNSPGLLRSLAVLASRAGQVDRLLQLVEEGLALAALPRDRRRFLLLKAHALRQADRFDEALLVAQEVAALAERAGDLVDYGAALGQLEQAYNALGRLPESEAALRQALDVYARLGMPGRMPQLLINLAGLLLKQGQHDAALVQLDSAASSAEQEQGTDLALLHETRGDVFLWRSQHALAVEHYRRAQELCDQLRISILSLRIAPKLCQAALPLGRLEVVDHALNTLNQAVRAGLPTAEANQKVCIGLLARHEQRWTAALEALAEARAFRADLGTAIGHRAVVYHAEACWRAGRFDRSGATALDHDLADAQPFHFLPEDAPLLEQLSRRCIDLQAPIVALNRLTSDAPSKLTTEVPAPPVLSLRTLGTLQVHVAGTAVHIPLRKSAEVLIWLALYGPSSRDQMIAALWDGSNERRHIEYFKVAVRHLRLALASPPSVTFNPLPYDAGQYRLSERFQLDLDVHIAAEALRSPSESSLRRALSVYAGPFLAASDAEWSASVRLESLEATVAVAFRLAELLEGTAPDEAAAIYHHLIAIDPLQEDAYVRLIRLCQERGDRASAKQVYLKYRRMLKEEWGRSPDQALAAAYDGAHAGLP
ncbi:BTAD domain-containing putative transcriptional regulator [Deinococcus sonorensis]|uniref:BTAD domain-containing putative transcriptional regulator n=2 Tax=Deinococcus sonorensis TaxID=309891 RepID=A0AAU7UHP9_9DEIO